MSRLLVFLVGYLIWAGAAAAQPATTTETLGSGLQWVTSGSNVTQITTGGRYTWRDWYGQLDMGGYSATEDFENNFFLGLSGGRRVALHRHLHLGGELGYRHIMPDGTDDPAINTEHHFSLSLRLKLELSLNRHLGFFIGTGIDWLYSGYSLGSPKNDEGLVFWGVSVL